MTRSPSARHDTEPTIKASAAPIKSTGAADSVSAEDAEALKSKVSLKGCAPSQVPLARPKKIILGFREKKTAKASSRRAPARVDKDAREFSATLDDRGKELLENPRKDSHPSKDLEDTKSRLAALLVEIDSLVKQTPALVSDIQNDPMLRQCFVPFNRAASATEVNDFGLPTVAPKLWADRDRSSRGTALEFIERIYADYLSEITLTYLRDLDPQLYSTLNTWIGRNSKPIPKKLVKFFKGGKGARTLKVDRELQELGIKKPSDAYSKLPNDRKRADRLYQAALRRQI